MADPAPVFSAVTDPLPREDLPHLTRSHPKLPSTYDISTIKSSVQGSRFKVQGSRFVFIVWTLYSQRPRRLPFPTDICLQSSFFVQGSRFKVQGSKSVFIVRPLYFRRPRRLPPLA